MKQRFLKKVYPPTLLEESMDIALTTPREDTLCNKPSTTEVSNSAPTFITKYNHQFHTIQKTLRKHWGILKNDPTLSKFLDNQPQIIFTRAPNLQLMLAPTTKPESADLDQDKHQIDTYQKDVGERFPVRPNPEVKQCAPHDLRDDPRDYDVASVIPLLKQSIGILMQRTPPSLDNVLPECYQRVQQLQGVYHLHDPHFWTLCTDVYIGTLKLVVAPEADARWILSQTHNIFTQVGVRQLYVQIDSAAM
ncbi:zinc transporter 7 [Pelobates cultripes]|uniref:Zinc transporter n=1 Tax=Pelobates cultripes TaxID=61616 RepID=A0AAD1SXU0_PELCU|nr:zinc transporter 7 [Pelobates cultripes]